MTYNSDIFTKIAAQIKKISSEEEEDKGFNESEVSNHFKNTENLFDPVFSPSKKPLSQMELASLFEGAENLMNVLHIATEMFGPGTTNGQNLKVLRKAMHSGDVGSEKLRDIRNELRGPLSSMKANLDRAFARLNRKAGD